MIVATVDGVTCGVISVVDTQIVCKTGAHPGNVKASVSITKLGQGQALYVRIRSCCPIKKGEMRDLSLSLSLSLYIYIYIYIYIYYK